MVCLESINNSYVNATAKHMILTLHLDPRTLCTQINLSDYRYFTGFHQVTQHLFFHKVLTHLDFTQQHSAAEHVSGG